VTGNSVQGDSQNDCEQSFCRLKWDGRNRNPAVSGVNKANSRAAPEVRQGTDGIPKDDAGSIRGALVQKPNTRDQDKALAEMADLLRPDIHPEKPFHHRPNQ
jgi:hypothetical protein